MTHRERLQKALRHEQTDRPPIDLGATACSGIHALAYGKLRKALGLQEKPVFVYESLQQLGYVEEDVRKELDIDVIGLLPYTNSIGVKNEPLKLKDYPVPQGGLGKCIAGFEYDIASDGDRYAYPQGNREYSPSYKMPAGGYFYDCINRSNTSVDDETDPEEDYAGAFPVMNEEEAKFYMRQVKYYRENTDYGIISNAAVAALGDAAFLPGASLLEPKGIRCMDEWLIAHKLRPEYNYKVNEMQSERALKSLKVLHQAVGDEVDAIFLSGTDFGTQNSAFIAHEDFCKLYKPFYRKINKWIHENTKWKIMYHSCGSIVDFLDDFAEIGVDILNPVQCSAKGMAPDFLKEKYGKKFVFWGGGIDTQKTLPFGSVEECKKECRNRINIFSKDGGYVFNTIHNIQANTPIENIVAVFDEAKKCPGEY